MTDDFGNLLLPPLSIAVLGAGYIGRAVAGDAVARGHRVWAVRRSPVLADGDGVTWLRGDLASGTIDGFPEVLDVVVLTVAPSSGDGYDETYPPAAAAAVALAKRHGARRLLYTSSTGVYGGRGGEWVTESSERRGEGPGNAALIAAEDILLASGFDGLRVLRVAGIYGPGRDPRGRMRNAAALPQRGEYWANLAHRDDIVGAARHLMSTDVAGTVFNVCDGTPTRAAEIARWLTEAAGGDPDTLSFGNAEQRSRNDQRVSNAALVAAGWAPLYPSFREGFTSGI
jgi:nucleoside-diphosphate-sugar epimerase